VEGTSIVDECAPANGTGPAPLDQALKAGTGMDGKEGSLCAVKPAEGASGQQARAPAAQPCRARTSCPASQARWLQAGVQCRAGRPSGGAAMPWPWPGVHHATVVLVAHPAYSESIRRSRAALIGSAATRADVRRAAGVRAADGPHGGQRLRALHRARRARQQHRGRRRCAAPVPRAQPRHRGRPPVPPAAGLQVRRSPPRPSPSPC